MTGSSAAVCTGTAASVCSLLLLLLVLAATTSTTVARPNSKFQAAGGVVRREGVSCTPSHRNIYYKFLPGAAEAFDAYAVLLGTWDVGR